MKKPAGEDERVTCDRSARARSCRFPAADRDLDHRDPTDALERHVHVVFGERDVAAVSRRQDLSTVELLDGREEILFAFAVDFFAAILGVGVFLHDDMSS
ncbi:MAG TPA: hypothetical protein VGG74_07190 [Kofleriaceae bacterium]